MGIPLSNLNDAIPGLAASIALGYAYALTIWPLLRENKRLGVVAMIAAVELAFPLLIPAKFVGLRALSMFLVVDLAFKIIDYARYCRETHQGRLGDYLRFLIPFPVLLVTYHPSSQNIAIRFRRWDILGACGGLTGFAWACWLVPFANTFSVVQSSFILDHAIKLVLFVVAVESMSRFLLHLERILGYDTNLLINNAWLSRTVGEFWVRYNTRVHAWLDKNVFQPAGGFRSPVRAILLTFFISAVFHEVGFGIATSRFDGYQFLFFMSQAPAALLTAKLKHAVKGWGKAGSVVLHLTTICWFAVISIFFLHGVNRVFPWIYASPLWLP